MVIEPANGESLRSWLQRYAAFLEVPTGQLAVDLGFAARERRGDVRPVLFGIDITPGRLSQVATATGLDQAAVAALHLARYRSAALDLSRIDFANEQASMAALKHEWGLWHWSRSCTMCVGSSGIWRIWWKLGMAAVCPLHSAMLADVCPRCGIRLQHGFATHPRGLSRTRVAAPDMCGNHTNDGPCTQPLRMIATVRVPAAIGAFQQVILDAADGGACFLAETPVTGANWFAALRYLCGAVRFAAEVPGAAEALVGDPGLSRVLAEDGRRRAGANGSAALLFASPQSAALAAALMSVVVPVLTARDGEAAVAALSPVTASLAQARRQRPHRHNPLRSRPAPAVLEELLAAATPTVGVAATVPRGVQRLPALACIPQLLDADDYRELVAALLPGTSERTGRRFAALSLMRLCGTTSWPEAGRRLGMPPAAATAVADRPSRRVSDPNRYWAAIAAAGVRLAQRPHVDVAARRRALADLTAVPAEDLRDMLTPAGLAVTAMRCRHAAAWMWADLTGGDMRDAPAYDLPWAATTAARWAAITRFNSQVAPRIAVPLRAWGMQRLDRAAGGRDRA